MVLESAFPSSGWVLLYLAAPTLLPAPFPQSPSAAQHVPMASPPSDPWPMDEAMSTFESQVRGAAARHAELLQVLAETDYAPPALEHQARVVANLDSQIGLSNQKLKQLTAKREAEHRELGKLRDSQVRRFMYKAACQQSKLADRAEQGERDYSEVVQRVRRERAINADLRHQRAEAALCGRRLEAMARLHVGARRKLERLYRSLFSGPLPQFPEDEAKARCDRVETAYHGARAVWEAESGAVQLLDKADGLLDEALARIRDALSYSRADRFAGGGVYDMMERNRVAQADHMVALARLEVARAQRASPQVKALPGVDVNNGRVLRDLGSDVFADRAFRRELKRAALKTQRCATDLKAELEAKQDRRDVELADARDVLQKARERVFAAVLGLRDRVDGGGGDGGDPGRRRRAEGRQGARGHGGVAGAGPRMAVSGRARRSRRRVSALAASGDGRRDLLRVPSFMSGKSPCMAAVAKSSDNLARPNRAPGPAVGPAVAFSTYLERDLEPPTLPIPGHSTIIAYSGHFAPR